MRQDVQALIERISELDGIVTHPHRFGGIEFNYGKVEIGHVHSNGMVDIPFTRSLREHLVADNEAELHHLLQDSGWITFFVHQDGDVENAVRLFELSYLQKTAKRNPDLDHATIKNRLTELNFSQPINDIILKLKTV
jgi:hypothetical protein